MGSPLKLKHRFLGAQNLVPRRRSKELEMRFQIWPYAQNIQLRGVLAAAVAFGVGLQFTSDN
jgi:hypothetical protein